MAVNACFLKQRSDYDLSKEKVDFSMNSASKYYFAKGLFLIEYLCNKDDSAHMSISEHLCLLSCRVLNYMGVESLDGLRSQSIPRDDLDLVG